MRNDLFLLQHVPPALCLDWVAPRLAQQPLGSPVLLSLPSSLCGPSVPSEGLERVWPSLCSSTLHWGPSLRCRFPTSLLLRILQTSSGQVPVSHTLREACVRLT